MDDVSAEAAACEVRPSTITAKDYCITVLRANREAGLQVEAKHVQMILDKLIYEDQKRNGT